MVSEHPIYALFEQGDIESALNQYGGAQALKFACAWQESPSNLKASLLMAIVKRYHDFISILVNVEAEADADADACTCAIENKAKQLIDAIEDGSVNQIVIANLIASFPRPGLFC